MAQQKLYTEEKSEFPIKLYTEEQVRNVVKFALYFFGVRYKEDEIDLIVSKIAPADRAKEKEKE